MKYIHIVGCPRSGTNLLKIMMATCFKHDWACEKEHSILKPLPITKGISITKRPDDARMIDTLIENCPNLYIIYIVRDPRGVITSRHKDYPDSYHTAYPHWLTIHRTMLKWKGHSNVCFVKYEDLTTHADVVQNAILKQFPFLETLHSFSHYQQHIKQETLPPGLNGLRHTDSQRNIGWKQHLPRIKEQIENTPSLPDDLIKYGYEDNKNWLKDLAFVNSIQYPPSKHPSRPHLLKKIEKAVRTRSWLNKALKRLNETQEIA